MASGQEFARLLSPLLYVKKKMELELTCGICSKLLKDPVLLPCDHIFCSQCISTGDRHRNCFFSCPSPYSSGDIRRVIHTKAIVELFKSIDAVITAIIQKLDSAIGLSGTRRLSINIRTLGDGSTDGNLPGLSGIEVLSGGGSTFRSSPSEVPLGESLVDILRSSVPSADCRVSGKTNIEEKVQREIAISGHSHAAEESPGSLASKAGVSRNAGSLLKMSQSKLLIQAVEQDEDLQGTRCGVEVPEKGSSVSSNNGSRQCLPEELIFGESGGQSMNHAHTQAHREKEQSGQSETSRRDIGAENTEEVTNLNWKTQDIKPHIYNLDPETEDNHPGSLHEPIYGSHALQSEKKPLVDVSQNIGAEAKPMGNRGLIPSPNSSICEMRLPEKKNPTSSRPSSLLDEDNTRRLKRQMNCPLESEQDNQFMHVPRKLPKLEPQENITANTSLSPMAPSTLLGDSSQPNPQKAVFGKDNGFFLCGSDLSNFRERMLGAFSKMTGVPVSRRWHKDVTHVIVCTDGQGICSCSKEVLMAILGGKWVISIDWTNACISEKRFVPEERYEVTRVRHHMDVALYGPKKGRLRATRKERMIFSGRSFYICANQFKPSERSYYEELIVAAGGKVLKEDEAKGGIIRNSSSSGPSYIVYNEELPQVKNMYDCKVVGMKRSDEAAALAKKTNFWLIGNLRLVVAIASCSSLDKLGAGMRISKKSIGGS